MRGSRNFLSGGGWGWGGDGVEARRPENSPDNVFLVINLFYSLQSGSNGFITEGRRGVQLLPGGGVSIETHITCDSPEGGGSGPLISLWIHTWGRLTPLFAYRIVVYQNLNKTEKYRKKSYLLLVEIASADPEGGPDPLENYKLYGFL